MLGFKKAFWLYKSLFFNVTLISLFCIAASANSQSEKELKIVTSNAIPYSIEADMNSGLIYDIVELIRKDIGIKSNIEFYSWPRAQNIALNSDNVIIFPFARTEDREDHYTWIIDALPLEYVFLTKNSKILSIEEAKQLKRITVRRATPFQKFLEQNGFNNLRISPLNAENHLKFVDIGRAEAWFGSKAMIEYTISNKKNDADYQISEPFKSSRIYIAGSKKINVEDLKLFQKSYDKLLKNNITQTIYEKYR